MAVRFLLFSVLAGALAASEELAGVRMADEVVLGEQTLTLNGMAVREVTIFNVDVYVAGLYLEEKTSRAEEILRLDQSMRIHMEYVRSVERDDIAEAWIESPLHLPITSSLPSELPTSNEPSSKLGPPHRLGKPTA